MKYSSAHDVVSSQTPKPLAVLMWLSFDFLQLARGAIYQGAARACVGLFHAEEGQTIAGCVRVCVAIPSILDASPHASVKVECTSRGGHTGVKSTRDFLSYLHRRVK